MAAAGYYDEQGIPMPIWQERCLLTALWLIVATSIVMIVCVCLGQFAVAGLFLIGDLIGIFASVVLLSVGDKRAIEVREIYNQGYNQGYEKGLADRNFHQPDLIQLREKRLKARI